MKKAGTAALLVLLSLWSLSACAAPGSPEAAVPHEEVVTPQPPQTDREAHGTIEMTVEGEVELVPATLYCGDGYSFYLPEEGWEKDAEKDQWKSVDNDTVCFAVLTNPGSTAEEARQELLALYGDYYGFRDLSPDNTFSGYNGKDGQTMTARIVPYDGGMFLLWTAYPDAAEEGFSPRMTAILDTFQPVSPFSAQAAP